MPPDLKQSSMTPVALRRQLHVGQVQHPVANLALDLRAIARREEPRHELVDPERSHTAESRESLAAC